MSSLCARHAIIDKAPKINLMKIVTVMFCSRHVTFRAKIKQDMFAFRSCVLFHSKCNVLYYLENTGTTNLLTNSLGSLPH
jgi:hypothetical protein